MRHGISILVALGVSIAASTASAGVYLESATSKPGSKQPPQINKLWFDGGRMRSESSGKGEGAVTFFKNGAMYILDPASKSYRVMDKATVDQMAAKLGEARKKMEASMAGMPPERRAQVEKMLSQMGGGTAAGQKKRVLKNTGRTETAAGIKCAVWEASVDGQKEEELCAAAPGSVPGGNEMLKTLRQVGEMFKGFTETFSGNKADNAWRDLEKINGIPIVTRSFSGGKVTSENKLSTARNEAVAASRFEVPAGYTEKKLNLGTQ
jgi:hypothetical protein